MAPLFAHAQRHPAAARAAQTKRDILEIPFVAALLIVDNQVSVLQPDFIEVLSVEPRQAEAVEPIKSGEQSTRCRVYGYRGRRTRLRTWRGLGSGALGHGCSG